MATPIHEATSMSWLTYCPPSKKARLVPSMSAARRATASVVVVRAARYSATSMIPAWTAGTSRADQGETPKVANDRACSQCNSGGLWKNGMPSRRGTSQSPDNHIQRPTSA